MKNRILLVEDDEIKKEQINSSLSSINNKCKIDNASALNSGLKKLCENEYEVIILDMSLPIFERGSSKRFDTFAGISFLDEMKRINNNTPVVILTQYSTFSDDNNNDYSLDEIKQQCLYEYSNFIDVIYYMDIQWKDSIKRIMES